MSLEKEPFVNYNLGEKKKDTFTVRINDKERAWLDEGKAMLNISHDSRALKTLALVGKNVLLSTFGAELLAYLTNETRVRREIDTANKLKK